MKTIRVMRYPVLAMAAFQIGWNIVAVFFLGNFQSQIGDWIYSRDCGHTIACGGARFLLFAWGTAFATSIIIGVVRCVHAGTGRS